MSENLLIIGSGMATARLLEELVSRHYAGTITVIGEEPEPSYNRILLSSLLCGDKNPADLPLLEIDWYRRHRIKLLTGQSVTRVDTTHYRVETDLGESIRYDQLVFATGSRPYFPDISGIDTAGVMGFRTIADLQRIEKSIKSGQQAVVIGGGLLGLEAAHGLNAKGVAVQVVHRQHWLMNRQLDKAAGTMLESRLAARGIAFTLGASPQEILTADGRVTGVRLSSGEELPAQLVLFAAGITPNAELAAMAGIDCDRGIFVDNRLTTSDPSVHALGECCQLGDTTFGLVAPVWEQAAVLAAQLCGDESAVYHYRETPTQLKVSGIELFSSITVPDSTSLNHWFSDQMTAVNSQQVIRDPHAGVYRRLVFDGNLLVGAVLLGDRKDGLWYRELIDTAADITPIRPWLLFGREFCQQQSARRAG